MLLDIFKQLGRRIVLGIAAEDLFLLLGAIGQVNKIMDNVTESVHVQHSLDQGVHGVYAMHLGGESSLRIDLLIQTCNLPPGIEKLVGSKKASCFGIHSVTDDAKGIVFKKIRNIPLISGS